MNNDVFNKQLSKQERRQFKKQGKREEHGRERRKKILKKVVNTGVIILVIGGGIFALGWYAVNRPNLPPTTTQGHIEQSPNSHIVNNPIPESIQKHMLEHADGEGKPGIIIQYNCENLECEPDLIQKLTTLVEQYPDNVYLAPNKYDGKIILTKLGKRKILGGFDEQSIKNFIQP